MSFDELSIKGTARVITSSCPNGHKSSRELLRLRLRLQNFLQSILKRVEVSRVLNALYANNYIDGNA